MSMDMSIDGRVMSHCLGIWAPVVHHGKTDSWAGLVILRWRSLWLMLCTRCRLWAPVARHERVNRLTWVVMLSLRWMLSSLRWILTRVAHE